MRFSHAEWHYRTLAIIPLMRRLTFEIPYEDGDEFLVFLLGRNSVVTSYKMLCAISEVLYGSLMIGESRMPRG